MGPASFALQPAGVQFSVEGVVMVGTEDLRKAMVHYRALFDELLETRAAAAKEGRR